MLKLIMIISIVIILIVLLLTVLTTNKAYSYKHTIDPIDEHLENKHTNKKM